MVLDRRFPVGFLQLVRGGILGNTEDLVVPGVVALLGSSTAEHGNTKGGGSTRDRERALGKGRNGRECGKEIGNSQELGLGLGNQTKEEGSLRSANEEEDDEEEEGNPNQHAEGNPNEHAEEEEEDAEKEIEEERRRVKVRRF
jgi:hypothetical protein